MAATGDGGVKRPVVVDSQFFAWPDLSDGKHVKVFAIWRADFTFHSHVIKRAIGFAAMIDKAKWRAWL